MKSKYGNYGKMLSKPEECKLCGARVFRFYDEGICLMCKIKRTSEKGSNIFHLPY